MSEVLLQAHVNGLDEVYFTVGNIVTIGGGVIGTLAAFFALKYGQKANEKEIEKLGEEILNGTNGRRAIKKELTGIIDKKEEIIMKRIDKTQSEMKAYSEKTDQEFKEINSSISNVKQDTSEIKGMIQTLINKNNG